MAESICQASTLECGEGGRPSPPTNTLPTQFSSSVYVKNNNNKNLLLPHGSNYLPTPFLSSPYLATSAKSSHLAEGWRPIPPLRATKTPMYGQGGFYPRMAAVLMDKCLVAKLPYLAIDSPVNLQRRFRCYCTAYTAMRTLGKTGKLNNICM